MVVGICFHCFKIYEASSYERVSHLLEAHMRGHGGFRSYHRALSVSEVVEVFLELKRARTKQERKIAEELREELEEEDIVMDPKKGILTKEWFMGRASPDFGEGMKKYLREEARKHSVKVRYYHKFWKRLTYDPNEIAFKKFLRERGIDESLLIVLKKILRESAQ